MGTMNFPTSIKLNGVAIVPTPTEVGTGVSAWTNLFIDWDWTGWVKKQIDYAIGNRIGANCIGLIGCMDGVKAATISQSTVNSRWTQIASYCAGLGVYLYPKPCAFNQLTGCSNSDISTYVLSILSALSAYSNVVGCDIIEEVDAWNDGAGTMTAAIATRITTIYSSVKGSSSMPCTYSLATNWTDATMRTWADTWKTGTDYWDFHPYAANSWASPLVLSDMNYWFTNYSTNDIVFGESGSPQSSSVDTQNTFLLGVGNMMAQGDNRLRGWLHWAAQDQVTTPTSSQYGLHDASWNQRQNKANVMRKFTGGSIVRNNHQVLGS